MKISFGICLAPNFNRSYVINLIRSIVDQNIPEYEIILIGEYDESFEKMIQVPIKWIHFDESIKKGWITRKKNLLANAASYDIVCILHDYYFLGSNWYKGLQQYGEDWNILMNAVFRYEGDRHSDWLVNQKYMDEIIAKHPELERELMSVAPTENNGARWVCALPYEELDLSHIQYISGGYILAKKKIFTETPFDERFGWGEAAEDIIWSEQVLEKGYRFKFNPKSNVFLQKPGKWRVYEMTDNCVKFLKETYRNG